MLGPLAELVGRWKVQGHVHGEPVTGTVDAHLAVEGAWLVVRERILDAGGRLSYEDRCLYGRDRLTGDLVVHHFQEGGRVAVHAVLPTDHGTGVHWVPRGGGPRVELRRADDGWRVQVLALEAPGPAVDLRYRPTT